MIFLQNKNSRKKVLNADGEVYLEAFKAIFASNFAHLIESLTF